MESARITYLLGRHLDGTLTGGEQQELARFAAIRESAAYLEEAIAAQLHNQPDVPDQPITRETALAAVRNILTIDKTGMPAEEGVKIRQANFLYRWRWAAASIILLAGTMIAFVMFSDRQARQADKAIAATPADIAPGKNGAILTLGDGSQVVLDSIGDGVVAMQNGTQVRLQNGGLTYTHVGNTTREVTYNTMTTPKARQFQLVLPDGTKAWLNAASSITYPTKFSGKERAVKIAGEVYLEVAKNATMPFRVTVNDLVQIEVLGTHFNVNAYANEGTINTTLLEGSIAIAPFQAAPSGRVPSDRPVILKPGQQAQAAKNEMKVVGIADAGKVIAWKNGLFNFQGLTLGEALRQIERWYDIRVRYNETNADLVFGGKMYRTAPLSDILEMLEDMGVKYEWDGNTLTILQ